MSGRRFPWDLRTVPWSDCTEFTRGTWEGTILLSWGTGPHTLLATKRQLRKQGLRPGGQDPVAVLYFRCRRAAKYVFANLYLIAKALPVRPMTPARWAALDKAMAARRTCRTCGETGYAELPKAHRTCEACLYTAGRLDPASYLHDFLTGTPTLTATERADLDRRSRPTPAGDLAPVVAIPIPRSSTDSAHTRKAYAR